MAYHEQIYEGKYVYLKDGNQFSEENFSVLQEEKRNGNFLFKSEILSRVSTGEFLKIYVDYELTHQFEPILVKIDRSLGANKSVEIFNINNKERKIDYEFHGRKGIEKMEVMPNSRFHISTPAFVTKLIMTLSRKVDPVHRTGYPLIVSDNIWEVTRRLYEKQIYLENMSTDSVDIRVGKTDLNANFYKMFQYDKTAAIKEEGVPFYLSKHFNLPYKAEFPDGVVIQVEKLKNTESKYKKMF